jgi:hypothetical protein
MFKKKDVFFITFEEMADALVEAADFFKNGISNLKDVSAFTRQMKEMESRCDKYVHAILKELNKTFITPIEREDILELVKSLDDVVDGIEACASRFEMYHVDKVDEHMIAFADVLVRSVHQLKQAIHLLTQRKLLAMREYCIAVNELENEADDRLRLAITSLFADVKDPIELIKRKELYERLEQTTDSCEDVANTLESIIMRNS